MMVLIRKWMLVFTLLVSSAYAIDPPAPQSELNHVNQDIASIQSDLQQSTLKKAQLKNKLASIETAEGDVNQQIKNTQTHLSLQQQKINALQQASIPLLSTKYKNRELLKQQMRAAYVLSQQPAFELLMANNNIAATQRLLMYFHYITSAQMRTISQLQQSITSYKQNQLAIQQHYTQLLLLKKNQLLNEEKLQATQTKRQALMNVIDQHIKTKQEKLASLERNKERLKDTLTQLSQEMQHVAIHLPSSSHQAFSTLKGKLMWPLIGMVRHIFGTQIDQSELRWDGILINSQAGQAVHAVASGRVLFSKWLAGYGLLIIINHGNGYMTLYGRNQSLLAPVGKTVKAGDEIATAGKSGGFHHNALYFSIRHNNTALDPAHWCR